jgi:hypothetical protein
MNEHEIRRVLEDVVVASSPPPSMDPASVLATARADRRRRRATFGAIGAGAAVVIIAVGAVVVPGLSGTGPRIGPAAAGPRPSSIGQGVPALTSPPAASESHWPDGQTDRTARSGPRADRATELAEVLTSFLPAGIDVADATSEISGGPLISHEAEYDATEDGRDLWTYSAALPVAVDAVAESGLGRVDLIVSTARSSTPSDPCEAVSQYPREFQGECSLIDVDGAQVGVVEHGLIAGQVAVHVHEDGTYVRVTQSVTFDHSGRPAMEELPMTVEELAAITVDDRFHVVD